MRLTADPGLHWTAWQVASTAEELAECGALRRTAYTRAGKGGRDHTPMVEDLDHVPYATVMFWRSRSGQMAATCRLLMPRDDADEVDCDRHVDRPRWAPAAAWLGEGSRVAVDASHAGNGLLLGCGMAMNLALLRAGRRYMYACAAGRLRAYYATIGFQPLGVGFVHGDLGGVEHDLLLGHIPDGLFRRLPLPGAVWLKIYAPVLRQAAIEGLHLSPSGYEVGLQRLLGARRVRASAVVSPGP